MSISNKEIFNVMEQNLKLINIYRKENKIYLNQKVNHKQMNILNYGMKIIKQVIDISPQPSTVIDKYRGTDFIDNRSYNTN